jgi:hypothetical protein
MLMPKDPNATIIMVSFREPTPVQYLLTYTLTTARDFTYSHACQLLAACHRYRYRSVPIVPVEDVL